MPDLSDFTSEELRAELRRRERGVEQTHWKRLIAEAKYLCHGCGFPDGWHAHSCPEDTD